jgi:hypothetical protein
MKDCSSSNTRFVTSTMKMKRLRLEKSVKKKLKKELLVLKKKRLTLKMLKERKLIQKLLLPKLQQKVENNKK